MITNDRTIKINQFLLCGIENSKQTVQIIRKDVFKNLPKKVFVLFK